MAVETRDTDDRPATTGPDARSYECYETVFESGDLLVYHVEHDDGWIQSDLYVSLERMR